MQKIPRTVKNDAVGTRQQILSSPGVNIKPSEKRIFKAPLRSSFQLFSKRFNYDYVLFGQNPKACVIFLGHFYFIPPLFNQEVPLGFKDLINRGALVLQFITLR